MAETKIITELFFTKVLFPLLRSLGSYDYKPVKHIHRAYVLVHIFSSLQLYNIATINRHPLLPLHNFLFLPHPAL
jgi:hypothetical protein